MLRYKTETRPGLVALYDIRPGNGAGQFLQPRSLHRAVHLENGRLNAERDNVNIWKHEYVVNCWNKTLYFTSFKARWTK